MCVELLTYADLGDRLDVSREAARSLARRRRLPRSRSEDGKALVSVDVSELRYTPAHDAAAGQTRSMPPWHRSKQSRSRHSRAEVARLEAVATAYRAMFERERADRLAVELTQAAAETTAANAWAALLEDEVAVLRNGRHAGGAIAGQAARRLGRLVAAIVEADRATRR
ncbi:hypothetical protein QCM77_01880 [Bradyrhizobium sp. SSUT18]|uniref:hypothetical protein n=1 Tax=Bradyrhizobium sp. SSUT18 TaxID=3040602 RepID=UPI00244B543F|nr:hypothetical protein [Bradyrhizobium sp. SSUT18]MDH2398739.1 hypothetical protein [Bradyrhizobium sp. SSUT18]